MMGTLKVIDRKMGDRRITWDKGKAHEVEDARASFDHHVKQGSYAAYRVDKKGGKGEQIREFDPSAEEIILAPPMVGG